MSSGIVSCDSSHRVNYQDDLSQYTTLTIDKSCQILGRRSLNYPSVTKLNLPDTITTIEDDFSNSPITYIFIPSSAINISNQNPFNSLHKLINFEVAFNNTVLRSYKGVLYNKNMSKMIMYPRGRKETKFTVPKSVTTIGYHAFYFNYYIETIILQRSIDLVDYQAFYHAKNLISIAIPINTSIVSFGFEAFNGTSIDQRNVSYYVPINVCYEASCMNNNLISLYFYIPSYTIMVFILL